MMSPGLAYNTYPRTSPDAQSHHRVEKAQVVDPLLLYRLRTGIEFVALLQDDDKIS